MTPIVTTYDIELLLVEFMLSDEPIDLGPVLRVANSLYDKSPEPEGYCDFSKGHLRHLMVGGTSEAYQARERADKEYGGTAMPPESFKEGWADYKADRVLPVKCGSADPQIVSPEPLVDPVDGGIGVTYESHRCPFGDPCSG